MKDVEHKKIVTLFKFFFYCFTDENNVFFCTENDKEKSCDGKEQHIS